MLIEVKSRGFELTQSLLEHVQNQVQAGLGRIGRRIKAVVVRLSDINGDHGGEDKSCQVQIVLPSSRTVMTQTVHRDMYASIAGAIEKARYAASRQLKRRTANRHRRDSLRRSS